MRRAFTALGVDYDQWKALTVAAIRTDLRTGSLGGARTHRRRGGKRILFGQLLFHGVLGVFMAFVVGSLGDSFVAGTLLFSYVMAMVGTAMLVDHNTAVISPDDYGIIGFQPVGSRTFFASKLANALFYTGSLAAALGVLPAVVIFVKYGPMVGGASVLALAACAVTVTLVIVAGYGALLNRVGANRLRLWLSYVQLATGFLVYGGFFLTSQMVSRDVLAGLSLPRTPWLLALPPTWYASYLELASGSRGILDLVPVVGSFGVMGFLVTRLRGKMSLEYAARLGDLSSATASATARRRPRAARFWFRRGEARATMILLTSHFRNDLKFRMGVLGILPLTVLYLILGFRDGGGSADAAAQGFDLTLVTMAAMLFPILLKMNLAYSDSFKASWVFFATPTDRTRLIRSAKNALVALFLVPYLLFLGIALVLLRRDPAWVVGYLLLVGALSHVALLMAVVADPELPFSKPVEKGRGPSRMFGTVIVIGVLAGLVPVLARWVYGSEANTAVAVAGICLATVALRHFTRRRVERRSRSLEFQG